METTTKEDQLVERIKKMLADTAKGMATKDELKRAVTDTVAEEFARQKAEQDKAVADLKGHLDEAETTIAGLQRQIRHLLNTNFADIKDAEGHYRGAWPNLETAKRFGLFILADLMGSEAAAKELDDLGIVRRRLVGNDVVEVKGLKDVDINIPSGGALVPTEFLGLWPSLLGRYGVFRRNAAPWPMASDSATAGVQTSDVVVYAPGAGVAPTTSSPGFRNVGLNARKMMTLTAVDSELTEDAAIAIGEIVGRSIARAFAKYEDKCGFLGDGTSTYFNFFGIVHSILNVDPSDVTNIMAVHVQATAGDWSKIAIGDLLAVVGAIDGDADEAGECRWFCHRNFYYTVMLDIALALGGAQANEAIQTGYTPSPMFLGRPVEHTAVLPRTKPAADHVPLILGNLQQGAVLGEARQIEIKQDDSVYFATDQTGIRGTERIAINVHSVGTKKDAAEPMSGAIAMLRADIA